MPERGSISFLSPGHRCLPCAPQFSGVSIWIPVGMAVGKNFHGARSRRGPAPAGSSGRRRDIRKFQLKRSKVVLFPRR